MYVYKYILYTKYNSLQIYNVICVYDFRVCHLVLGSQFVCSFLGKNMSLNLTIS